MNDIVDVNPQVMNTIEAIRQASLTGSVITHSGAGKAYQSVAQSSAIAIQDATDQLRNFGTIGTTAAGVAVAQMLATGDVAKYSPIISEINTMLTNGATNFQTVGQYASELLTEFPTGNTGNTGGGSSGGIDPSE